MGSEWWCNLQGDLQAAKVTDGSAPNLGPVSVFLKGILPATSPCSQLQLV